MKQSLGFADLAKSYTIMANKIAGAIPTIQKNAGKAAVFAMYPENPTGELPAKDLFPFTVVPPLSFLQNGAYTSPTASPKEEAPEAPEAAREEASGKYHCRARLRH